MPSPVTPDSVPDISEAQKACEVAASLLETNKQLDALTAYLFTAQGTPNIKPAREFGAIILPHRTTLDMAFPANTPYAGIGGVLEQVETMWLTGDEKTQYQANRANIIPFWTVADHFQAGGAPDLSGRFKISADFRALDTGTNVSGVVGLAPPSGAKSVILSEDEMPSHDHKITVKTNMATDDNGTGAFDEGRAGNFLEALPSRITVTMDKTGGGKAHPNMPPYYVVVVACRTDRMF